MISLLSSLQQEHYHHYHHHDDQAPLSLIFFAYRNWNPFRNASYLITSRKKERNANTVKEKLPPHKITWVVSHIEARQPDNRIGKYYLATWEGEENRKKLYQGGKGEGGERNEVMEWLKRRAVRREKKEVTSKEDR